MRNPISEIKIELKKFQFSSKITMTSGEISHDGLWGAIYIHTCCMYDSPTTKAFKKYNDKN